MISELELGIAMMKRQSWFTARMFLMTALVLSVCSSGEVSTVITAGPPTQNAALAVVPQQGRKYWALAIAETPPMPGKAL